MKKILLTLSAFSLVGLLGSCAPAYTTKEWKYSKVTEVEMNSVILEDEYYSEMLEDMMGELGITNLNLLNASLLAKYNLTGEFEDTYVKFNGTKTVNTYDIIAEREVTHYLKQVDDTNGYLVFTDYELELPVEELSRETTCSFTISEDGSYLYLTSYHINHFVTVEYTAS